MKPYEPERYADPADRYGLTLPSGYYALGVQPRYRPVDHPVDRPDLGRIVEYGYFHVPSADPVTAIVTDRSLTTGLGLDDAIQRIRQRYEIYRHHVSELEASRQRAKCAAQSWHAPEGWIESGRDLPQLDARCALTEVVELLERGFRGTWADGYDGALLEVIQDPEHGADRVLAALLQLVQQRARERRIHLLTRRMIDALDWRQRAAVAAELRRRLAGDSGNQLTRLPAALLAPHVLEMAQALLETNRQLERLLHDPRQLLP